MSGNDFHHSFELLTYPGNSLIKISHPIRSKKPGGKTMEMLSGAEMVVRSFIDQGVKHVGGYPGGAVLDIYDALNKVGGIDYVLVRHEEGVVHMADGFFFQAEDGIRVRPSYRAARRCGYWVPH